MNTLTLTYLREAVRAKIAYWDASRALEIHLGLDDPTAAVDKAIQDEISWLASGYPEGAPDMRAVTPKHVAELLETIEGATA